MQTVNHVVRLQDNNGVWQTCGAGLARGVFPENLQASANAWGPDKASFDLKRHSFALWPDISAATPVEIEIGGVLVWAGRVRETPTKDSDRTINVQCEGWQYHLDDDVYEKVYVHTKVGDYKDMRTFPNAVLGINALNAAGGVNNDNGVIQLVWAKSVPLATGCMVGVTLDLGVYSLAKRVVLEWDNANNTPGTFALYCRGSDGPTNANWSNIEDAFKILSNAGVSGTTAGTFATPRRCIQFFMYNEAAYNGVTGDDHWFKLKAIRVFTSTAYETGNQSILKATDVVKDARDQATALLSSSNDRIPDTAFSIPEFGVAEPRTPREVITAVNAFHDQVAAVNPKRELVFEPKISYPIYEVGDWAGADFEDTSANSLEEIYNRAFVTGTDGAGDPVRVIRDASLQSGAGLIPPTGITIPNPSFDTNAASWTVSGPTPSAIVRSTSSFDSAPAGGSWDSQYNGRLETTFTGTFKKGRTYLLQFKLRYDSSGTGSTHGYAAAEFGSGGVDIATYYRDHVQAEWNTISLTWTPTKDATNVKLTLFSYVPSSTWTVDTLTLFVVGATLLDRRGFRRTKIIPVQSAINTVVGTQLGDIFLSGHKTTPFKGKMNVTEQGGVRKVWGGSGVHPAHLLLSYGQLCRFTNRVDPDTGGLGRDGRIAAASYSQAEQAANVDIDSQRGNFEAFLERLSVVTGQSVAR